MDLALLLQTSRTLDAVPLQQARRMSEVLRLPLAHVLVRYGFVDPKRLVLLLGRTLSLAPVDVDRAVPAQELVEKVPEQLSLALRALPLSTMREGRETVACVAMTDPTDASALRQLGRVLGMRARPLLAEDAALERAIRRHHAAMRVPLDDESAEIDDLPTILGKALVQTSGELDGEPSPFGPFSADGTEEFPSVPLASYEADALLGPAARSPGAAGGDAPATGAAAAFGVPLLPALGEQPRTDPVVHDVPAEVLRSLDTVSDAPAFSDDATRVFEPFVRRRACFVSDDLNVRRRVERDTRDLLENLHTEASIAHVLQLGIELDDLVLYRPRSDERTRELLARLSALDRRPEVVVVSEDDALDDAPGVRLRLPLPEEPDALSAVVLHALAQRR